ncbi:MAG: topoisomerase DNA-binding C4 zinc finger domain-containing protein [Acetatifactor sp.]|nr:topoisomerase DNA-binding C4 zinc finger domain-containing protein [Acetatifactor sp.]
MAQRTVALYKGKYIGVETIYTVVNGRQINIPEKLKELRAKSQNNELFCPCGCGANLILVAGDKNLREQHFRIKDGDFDQKCNVITEGKTSVDSKIVLKCWLDDKLKAADVESRVPIHAVDDINRSYEFSFLSQSRKTALSYCHERVNLSDEKLSILESNSQGIHIIYIVDHKNGGCSGQYPEGLMKVQHRQGYCLLLTVESADYNEAGMEAAFYAQDIDGLWQEVVFAEGSLRDFSINDDGQILYADKLLSVKLSAAMDNFRSGMEGEKVRRAEKEKRYAETAKKLLEQEEYDREERRKRQEEVEQERRRQAEEAAKRREEFQEKQRLERERQQAEKRQREEDFKRNMESNFSQQETPVRDADGRRWIKCEFCGKIAVEGEFSSYGGKGHINLGTCKDCSGNNPAVSQKAAEKMAKAHIKYDHHICPECGGRLRERNGQYGRFMGCSNYPACRYSCRLR